MLISNVTHSQNDDLFIYLLWIFSIKETWNKNMNAYEVFLVDHSRIQSLYGELHDDTELAECAETSIKRKCM